MDERSDSSVALVCAMHPAVLLHWLAFPEVPPAYQEAWQQERETIFRCAQQGSFFGTITSEPGSGGDIARTRAVAERAGSGYVLSGQKQFGSGSGIMDFLITTALPEGESEPDWFLLDVRGVSWDGSCGMTLTNAWEGHGMTATQSHGMSFSRFPALRCAWPGQRRAFSAATGSFVACLFASVVTGVVDAALELAHDQLGPRRATLRPFEQVELARAEIDAWLIAQAQEGMLRAAEATPPQGRQALQGKLAIAELAESCLSRLCRVLGGGTYSRRAALGHLFEDVRALGFLRPPWGLAYDDLIMRTAGAEAAKTE